MELQNSTDKMEKRLQAVSVTFIPISANTVISLKVTVIIDTFYISSYQQSKRGSVAIKQTNTNHDL